MAVLWYRPEAGNIQNFDLGIKVSTNWQFMEFYLQVQEQGAIFYKSLIESNLNNKATNYAAYPSALADFDINNRYNAAPNVDPFWQYNFVNVWFPNWANSAYYAEQPIWGYWLFGKANF